MVCTGQFGGNKRYFRIFKKMGQDAIDKRREEKKEADAKKAEEDK